jgi:hypothetical protein
VLQAPSSQGPSIRLRKDALARQAREAPKAKVQASRYWRLAYFGSHWLAFFLVRRQGGVLTYFWGNGGGRIGGENGIFSAWRCFVPLAAAWLPGRSGNPPPRASRARHESVSPDKLCASRNVVVGGLRFAGLRLASGSFGFFRLFSGGQSGQSGLRWGFREAKLDRVRFGPVWSGLRMGVAKADRQRGERIRPQAGRYRAGDPGVFATC